MTLAFFFFKGFGNGYKKNSFRNGILPLQCTHAAAYTYTHVNCRFFFFIFKFIAVYFCARYDLYRIFLYANTHARTYTPIPTCIIPSVGNIRSQRTVFDFHRWCIECFCYFLRPKTVASIIRIYKHARQHGGSHYAR